MIVGACGGRGGEKWTPLAGVGRSRRTSWRSLVVS